MGEIPLTVKTPMPTLGAGSYLGLCHLSRRRQATTLEMAYSRSWRATIKTCPVPGISQLPVPMSHCA